MAQPPAKQFSGIFVSYRRDDSSGHAGRLFDNLAKHFGEDQIFMDIDTIEPGEDFVEVIEKAVGSCEIVVAVMGPRWLSISDGNSRRLDNPDDFVRLEIATALKRNIRVIPVLVQKATMPRPEDLPEDIARLSRRNAVELSDSRWQYDVAKLINVLEKVLAVRQEARLAETARQAEEERRCQEDQQKQRAEEDRQRRLAAEEADRRAAEENRREAVASRRRGEEERQRVEAEQAAALRRLQEEEQARGEKERLRQATEEAERIPEQALQTGSQERSTGPDLAAPAAVPVSDHVAPPSAGHAMTDLTDATSLRQDKRKGMPLFVNVACVAVLAASSLIWIGVIPLYSIVARVSFSVVGALLSLAVMVIVWRTKVPPTSKRARLFVIIASFAVLGAYTLVWSGLGLALPVQLMMLVCISILVFVVVVFVRSSTVPPTSKRRAASVIITGLALVWSPTVFLPATIVLAILAALVLAVIAFDRKTIAPPIVKLTAALASLACVTVIQTAYFRDQEHQYEGAYTYSSPAESSPSPFSAATENASRGDDLYKQTKYAEAEPYFHEAVRLQPDNAEYVNKLGDALYFQKKYREAESKYREAIRLRSENSEYNHNLGIALLMQTKYAEAEPYYREAVRLSPNASRHNSLGTALYLQGKYVEGETYYREAVRLQPGNARYVNNLGDALNRQQKYAQAETQYREAVRLEPGNAEYQEDLKRIP